MKKYFYLLFLFSIISCSPEEDTVPSFTTQSYTAEIGEIITITGTDLSGIHSIRIIGTEAGVQGATVYDKPGYTRDYYSFKSKTNSEIQFVLPELYSESYVMRMAEQEFPLSVKGFIPLYNVFDFYDKMITGLEIIDDDKAFVRLNKTLYLLENGYNKPYPIADEVHFFGVLENGDTWYATSTDYNVYEIFYSVSGAFSYTPLSTFIKTSIQGSTDLRDMIITPEKHVYFSAEKGIFIIKENEVRKATDIFPDLETHSLEERVVSELQFTPEGKIYGKLDNSNGYLVLDTENLSYHFTPKFGSHPKVEFYDKTGYLFLPSENKLLKSVDSGLTWSEFPIPTPAAEGTLRASKFNVLDEDTILIFLYSGVGSELAYTTVYITEDGGRSWQTRKQFNKPIEKENFMYFSDFKNNSGLLYFTDIFSSKILMKYVP